MRPAQLTALAGRRQNAGMRCRKLTGLLFTATLASGCSSPEPAEAHRVYTQKPAAVMRPAPAADPILPSLDDRSLPLEGRNDLADDKCELNDKLHDAELFNYARPGHVSAVVLTEEIAICERVLKSSPDNQYAKKNLQIFRKWLDITRSEEADPTEQYRQWELHLSTADRTRLHDWMAVYELFHDTFSRPMDEAIFKANQRCGIPPIPSVVPDDRYPRHGAIAAAHLATAFQ